MFDIETIIDNIPRYGCNWVAIDIEGDALHKSKNQLYFPNSPHWDPNTRIWCVSFTFQSNVPQGFRTITYVCKLPDKPRQVKPGVYTKSIHLPTSKVPSKLNNAEIREFDTKDYCGFLRAIFNTLLWLDYPPGFNIVCKPYGKYKFDEWVLSKEMNKYLNLGIEYDFYAFNPGIWNQTNAQVSAGKYIPNQQYLLDGIKHNIEDSQQLFQRVRDLEGDFV